MYRTKIVPFPSGNTSIHNNHSSKNNSICCYSKAMQLIDALIAKAARSTENILLIGEPGVGKDYWANIIHKRSHRANRPFKQLTISERSSSLIESELFGFEKNAFTGADKTMIGIFEEAHTGSLFLNEISTIPYNIQTKLLGVLDDYGMHIRRLGSNTTKAVDVRMIFATNEDLEVCVQNRTFREDLLSRIDTITITIPPLRERREDIVPLILTLSHEYATKHNHEPLQFHENALYLMQQMHWPRNVRQLKNVIRKLYTLRIHSIVTTDVLHSLDIERQDTVINYTCQLFSRLQAINEEFEQKKRTLLAESMEKHKWNISQAAKKEGFSRQSLQKLLKKYKLKSPF